MAGTDSNRLRVAALDLLISKPQPAKLMLGAVEFGSGANSLFKPGRIGPNAAGDEVAPGRERQGQQRLDELQRRALARDRPRIRARRPAIFLTDGGHNAGTYANGHRGCGPPTYVIGLTIGPAEQWQPCRQTPAADRQRDTGGSTTPSRTRARCRRR